MKIQCGCGTKYSFDVTPDMLRMPPQFVCQGCGQDNSAVINQLIQQQFAAAPPAARVAPSIAIAPPPSTSHAPSPVAVPMARPVALPVEQAPAARAVPPSAAPVAIPVGVPLPPPREEARAVRIATPRADAAQAAAATAPQVCLKHSPQLTTDTCLVCQKPICPKCMEVFGYVCSAYCKGKAENQGLILPTFAGQRDIAQSKQWQRVYWVVTAVGVVLLAVCSVWFWYAWFGSVPKVAYSARLTDTGLSGQLGSGPSDQLVFLHAGTLARHDTKTGKEIWANRLIDRPRIAGEAKAAFERGKAIYEQALANHEETARYGPPDLEEIVLDLESHAAGELHLYQMGEAVWVSFPDKLVRYDWQTGQKTQEVPLNLSQATRLVDKESLWVMGTGESGNALTRINLTTGEATSEELTGLTPAAAGVAAAQASTTSVTSSNKSRMQTAGVQAGPRQGKIGSPAPSSSTKAGGAPADKPMDPKTVAENYQRLPTPQRLALPAVAAANANQQRLLAEMKDNTDAIATGPGPSRILGLAEPPLLTKAGPLLVSSRLLESKMVTRKVMKDAPAKSALDGNLNASATAAVANEILNEMQRDKVGDTEQEDVSRYQVTVKRPTVRGVGDWQGEISGSPTVFPLDTVDVIAGAKSILVLDRRNKKLWDAKLNYNVRPAQSDRFGFSSMENPNGEGPCVERGDTLYVCDEGVVTSFDLASGTVRWRLPSVGTSGLFFDEQGMIYVNTTTATPDHVKYSRQIDVSDKLRLLVVKVEAKTGKTLWGVVDEGLVSYVSGKFVYTTDAHPGQGSANELFAELTRMFEIPAHINVRRLDQGSGRVLWQHYQKRAPLDVRFENNSFRVLFKHEVQDIRFISF
jgi:hypothetical protein